MGCGKVACWSTKVAISLKCANIDEKLLWRAYRKLQTLFQTVLEGKMETEENAIELDIEEQNKEIWTMLN